ncbi:bifunctional nuclease family protein [Parabacteroides pacaensis]|uniref:bifunctional nuclease family protein n=1 Tax=Parabacteroides pacaensis TaxID=2086575 RepID=UPI000D0F7EEE|nr:bifunctional nuclease family protein [Parabacteroides pacaensis]
MEKRVKLKVQGITSSQVQAGAYALILSEEDGPRRIPIIVGTPEAQSIVIALEGVKTPRPLTHDLFATFAQAFGIRLVEVYIYRFEEGIFFSELMFSDGERSIKVDSRTSDAIAIALRVKCDIYTSEDIVRQAGIVLEDAIEEEEKRKDLTKVDMDEEIDQLLVDMEEEELKEQLEQAVEQEDYELAKLINDELQRREAK